MFFNKAPNIACKVYMEDLNAMKGIFKNTLSLGMGRILPHFISIFLMVYAARVLQPSGYGKYITAVAFVGLFSIFYDFGLATLIVREVARNIEKINKYFTCFLSLKLLLSLLGFVLILLFTRVLGYPPEIKYVIFFVAISALALSIQATIEAFFQGIEKMKYVALTSLFERILTVSIGIIVLKLNYGLINFVKVLALCNIMAFVFSLFVYNKNVAMIRWEFDKILFKDLFKLSIPFAILFSVYIIGREIDIVLLSKMQVDKAVGMYAIPKKFIEILQYIPGVLAGAFYPVMSRLHVNSKISLNFINQKALKYMLYISLPIALFITIFAKEIVLLIYGVQYVEAVVALQIAIWSLFFIFLNTTFWAILNAINKTYVLVRVGLIMILINSILNIIFVSKWGLNLSFVGASIALLVSQMASFVLYLGYLSRDILQVNYFLQSLKKPLVACCIVGTLSFIPRLINTTYIGLIPFFIYPWLLYILKGFDEYDKTLALAIIGSSMGGSPNNKTNAQNTNL